MWQINLLNPLFKRLDSDKQVLTKEFISDVVNFIHETLFNTDPIQEVHVNLMLIHYVLIINNKTPDSSMSLENLSRQVIGLLFFLADEYDVADRKALLKAFLEENQTVRQIMNINTLLLDCHSSTSTTSKRPICSFYHTINRKNLRYNDLFNLMLNKLYLSFTQSIDPNDSDRDFYLDIALESKDDLLQFFDHAKPDADTLRQLLTSLYEIYRQNLPALHQAIKAQISGAAQKTKHETSFITSMGDFEHMINVIKHQFEHTPASSQTKSLTP